MNFDVSAAMRVCACMRAFVDVYLCVRACIHYTCIGACVSIFDNMIDVLCSFYRWGMLILPMLVLLFL